MMFSLQHGRLLRARLQWGALEPPLSCALDNFFLIPSQTWRRCLGSAMFTAYTEEKDDGP